MKNARDVGGQSFARHRRRSPAGVDRYAGGEPSEDLRAVLDLVNSGTARPPSAFKARFAEPVERDRDPVAAARLRG